MSFLVGLCCVVAPPCCVLDVEGVLDVAVLGASLKSIVRALCEPRAGGGSGLVRLLLMRWTSTHSGSGLGVKGLLGRCGLGM
jgi:hypothetical protein